MVSNFNLLSRDTGRHTTWRLLLPLFLEHQPNRHLPLCYHPPHLLSIGLDRRPLPTLGTLLLSTWTSLFQRKNACISRSRRRLISPLPALTGRRTWGTSGDLCPLRASRPETRTKETCPDVFGTRTLSVPGVLSVFFLSRPFSLWPILRSLTWKKGTWNEQVQIHSVSSPDPRPQVKNAEWPSTFPSSKASQLGDVFGIETRFKSPPETSMSGENWK